MNFVGFMYAAQSLCAALGSVQFVSNLILANTINGYDGGGSGALIVGEPS